MALDVYTRVGDFSDDETANAGGRSTVSTAKLDAELDAIKSVLDDARTKLSAIQRDDLKLTDDLLVGHEFSAAALSVLGAALSTGSLVFRGEWVSGEVYAVRDIVSVTGDGAFICVVAHTAPGAFVEAPNWMRLAADGAAGNPAAVVSVAAPMTVDASHNGKTLETTGSFTVTLPDAATMVDGFSVIVAPVSGSLILAASAGQYIDAAALVAISSTAGATAFMHVQVNAARTGWRVLSARPTIGATGSIVVWNGTRFSAVAPNRAYEALRATSASGTIFDGHDVPTVKTGAYALTGATDTQDTLRFDASGGGFSVTVPSAASVGAGFEVTVMKSDASSNAVTLVRSGAETINGLTSIALSIQYEFVTLLCDGSNWLIVRDGRKTLTGTNTLNLAAGASSQFDITHNFGTDDVDFGMEIYGSVAFGSGGQFVTGVMTAPDKRSVSVDVASGTRPTASVPSSGAVRVVLRNNHSATQSVTATYWVRRRTA